MKEENNNINDLFNRIQLTEDLNLSNEKKIENNKIKNISEKNSKENINSIMNKLKNKSKLKKRNRANYISEIYLKKHKLIIKNQLDLELCNLTDIQKNICENRYNNFIKNYNILKSDFEILEEYEKEFFKDTTLDIMFIMDLTGSMGMWLREAKENIKNIIDEITENNPCSKIRVSFVGYRDFKEVNGILQGQYIYKDFSENIEDIRNFISNIACYGGGDEPEDLIGALDLSLKMNWSSNARYAVLVCDAPCHGSKYHNINYDKYKNGDPNGLELEKIIENFKLKNITLYCIEISISTRKMFDIMKNIYKNEKFHVETLGNSTYKFSFFVALNASKLINSVTYNKIHFEEVIKNFRNEIIEKIMKKYNKNKTKDDEEESLENLIENLNLDNNEIKLCDFINRMKSLNINKKNNEKNNEKKIKYINLNEGIMKTFYNKEYNSINHFYKISNDNNVIIDWKNPLMIHKSYNSTFNFENKEIEFENNNYNFVIHDNFLDIKMQCNIPQEFEEINYNLEHMLKSNLKKYAICQKIINLFNIRIIEEFPLLRQYLNIENKQIIEIQNDNTNFPSKFIVANLSSLNYTNYYGVFLSNFSSHNLLSAFSHFSYQISEGNLIITNIKYSKEKNVIIDFDIIFLEKENYNHIIKFFVNHYCDDICKKFLLVHPRKKKQIFDIKFYSNFILSNTCLCECCNMPILFYNNKNIENICLFCNLKSIKDKKTMCLNCYSQFKFSSFYYKSRFINYPKKCENCLIKFK